MKEKMMKRIVNICLTLIFVFSSVGASADSYILKMWMVDGDNKAVSPVYTENIETKKTYYGYAYVSYIDYNGADENIKTIIYDGNSNAVTYDYKISARINGNRISDFNSVVNSVNKKFVKFQAIGNTIVSLETGMMKGEYQNVNYNAGKRCFEIGKVNTFSLPVYYGTLDERDEISKPPLDENHKYNIKVYDYGVHVTDYTAKNNLGTLKEVEFSPSLLEGVLTIDISFDSNVSYNNICVELYSEDMKYISSVNSPEESVDFYNIDNKEATYNVKMWLKDSNNQRITPVYTEKISVVPIVKVQGYGYAYVSYVDYNGADENVKTIIYDKDLNAVTYRYRNNITLNGERIVADNSIVQKINKVFVEYTALDGEIVKINTSGTPVEYKNVEYNVKAGGYEINGVDTSYLPSYYGTLDERDEISKPPLDENHIYNIKVYDYGVHVTDYTAKNNLGTLKEIEFSPFLLEGVLTLDISFDSDVSYNNICVELYSEDMKYISSVNSPEESVDFYNIDNKEATYNVKMWLKDSNNQRITPVYTEKISVVPIVKVQGYGYAYVSYVDYNGADENVKTIIYDKDLNAVTYRYRNNITLNGERIVADNSIVQKINKVFVEYTALDGEIVKINTSGTPVQYSNVKYNKSTGNFEINDKNQQTNFYNTISMYADEEIESIDISNSPVYYGELDNMNNISQAFLNENNLYDIELYDFGVNVIDLRAKNNLETIKNFYTNSSTDVTTKAFNFNFEVSDADYEVYAQLYDENMNLISESSSVNQSLSLDTEGAEQDVTLLPEIVSGDKIYTKPYTYVDSNGQEVKTASGITFARAEEQSGDYSLVEYGILFSNSELPKEEFKINAPGVKKADGKSIGENGRYYGILFYGPGIKYNATYYTLPYAIYKDLQGNHTTVYGNNIISFTPEEE